MNGEKKDNSSEEDNSSNEVKEEKKLRASKVKEENVQSKRLSDISPPKRRRILHRMMQKYRKDPFYTRLDIAKKILKKLKVPQTTYFMGRIKKEMEQWENENATDSSDSEEDEPVNIEKKTKPLQVAQKNDANVENEGKVEAVVANETKVTIDQIPDIPKIAAATVEPAKEIEIIDLTVEIKTEIKKEVEVVTIEEDSPRETEINTAATGGFQYVPYPAVYGYNYYPNFPMYNPYMQYQMPYQYNFYSSPSDILPNFPIDGGHASQPDVKNVPNVEAASASKDPAK